MVEDEYRDHRSSVKKSIVLAFGGRGGEKERQYSDIVVCSRTFYMERRGGEWEERGGGGEGRRGEGRRGEGWGREGKSYQK